MTHQYDDILALPHPVSSKYPKMPAADRAAVELKILTSIFPDAQKFRLQVHKYPESKYLDRLLFVWT